jgi:hypothetical protein
MRINGLALGGARAGTHEGFQPSYSLAVIACLLLAHGGVARAQSVRVSVREFGAMGDTRVVRDAAIEAGSSTLVSPSARFSAADAGRPVQIVDAGREGGPLEATIRSVKSPESVELSEAAQRRANHVSAAIGAQDGVAIRAAIEHVQAKGGGTVYFPSGTYKIEKSLTVTGSNVRLTGDGPTSILYAASFQRYGNLTKGSAVLPGGWTPVRLITVGAPNSTAANIEIDHLRIIGPDTPWVHASIGQALITTGTDSTVRVSRFKLHDMEIDANTLNAYSNGGVLDGFEVVNNDIWNVVKEGLYIAGLPSNGKVSGNRIFTSQPNAASISVGIAVKNLKHVEIAGNIIQGLFGACVSGNEFPQQDVLIKGNHCRVSAAMHGDGIYFDRGARIKVTGNVVEGAGAFGITFRGSDRLISDIAIDHNTVRNSSGGAAISVMGGEDPVNGPRDVKITGNQLLNDSVGIEAINLKGKSAIIGNAIRGSGIAGCTAFHLKAFPQAELLCADNSVMNCGTGSASCDGAGTR